MTKRKIKLLTILMLALSVVLFSYFGYLACCSDHAAAADSGIVLSDVDYHVVDFSSISLSYFTGNRNDPTVGSFFAYGIEPFKGYAIGTSWSVYPNFFQYNKKVTVGDKSGYLMSLSVDFLGRGFENDNFELNGKIYRQLGFLHLDNAINNSQLFYIHFLKSKTENEYYLYEAYTGFFSVLSDFSGSEGEFLNFTFLFDVPDYSVPYNLVTNFVFSRNTYSSVRLLDVDVLPNQYRLDVWSLLSYNHDLHYFEDVFASLDESISEQMADLVRKSYNDGYAAGYDVASKEVNAITSFTWLTSIFNSLGALFEFRLFGGVTLGTIVFIPIILGIVMLILHFVRG